MTTRLAPSFSSLQVLLDGVSRIPRRQKEETFFSIGGRGYYENPSSDLLAFFMSNHAHGLHHVFLGSFLKCMGFSDETCEAMVNTAVSIKREDKTAKGNRIDLTIHGKDWILLIENKIRHWIANPLDDYMAHATNIGGMRQKHYAILSPSGFSPQPEIWKSVSYRAFVDVVQARLKQPAVAAKPSKWDLLAHEFILHLNQEICQAIMTNQEAKFVEDHLESIETIKGLSDQYLVFVETELRRNLETAGVQDIVIKWEKWGGFEVSSSNLGSWYFGLTIPPHQKRDPSAFDVTIWSGLSETAARESFENYFGKFDMLGDDDGFQAFSHLFDRRDAAISEICRVARCLIGLPDPSRRGRSSCSRSVAAP